MNKQGKEIDTTYLSLDTQEDKGTIHRDYIAHCLRWSHAAKYIGTKSETKRVLDVGCGQEFPLPKLLTSGRKTPAYYAGVDMGKLDPKKYFNKSGRGWEPHRVWSETDVVTIPLDQFDDINTIVCFEVLEHVEPKHCIDMLRKFKQILTQDGRALLSTPCYDEKVGAADNHVNEMTYEAFGSLLESLGFEIEAHHGTFASQKDYVKHMTPEHKASFDALRKYYDSCYLSTIFAPMYPQHARNCIWRVKHAGPDTARQFGDMAKLAQPLGSSIAWRDLMQQG